MVINLATSFIVVILSSDSDRVTLPPASLVGSGKQRESRNGKRKPFASKEKNSVASKPLNVQVETEETETCDFYSCSQFCFSLLLFLIGLKEESLEVEVSSNS